MNQPHSISISLPQLSQIDIQVDTEKDQFAEEEKDTVKIAPIIVTHEDETESPFQLLNSLASKRPSSASSLHLSKFLTGYQRFHKNYFTENRTLYETLQNGQAPKTILIGCCDSRVDPAIITDCDPGDIFVVRNVANLVAPYKPGNFTDKGHHGTASALEYAVKVLKVESIVILGHSKCGGIDALMRDTARNYEFLGPWVEIGQKAKEKTLNYPWIVDRLKQGIISINGWYFDFETGRLSAYDPDTCHFELLDTEKAEERLRQLSTRKSEVENFQPEPEDEIEERLKLLSTKSKAPSLGV
ncbi:hypothetical protein HDV06_004987 [Boothiomyces sp. JEL0866]|nr:hypothetical protein HDV06_004954 [Boothiomyces sp. JEL0866]KAJ3325230.1 hypothetical protein HDV06_004987 [Boothiomyces sp. JEL0866]